MRSALAFPRIVVQLVGLFTRTTSLAKFVHGFVEVDAEDLLFQERFLPQTDEPMEGLTELNRQYLLLAVIEYFQIEKSNEILLLGWNTKVSQDLQRSWLLLHCFDHYDSCIQMFVWKTKLRRSKVSETVGDVPHY